MHWFPSADATSFIKEVLHVHEAIATPSPPDHLILFISHVDHGSTEHVLETQAAGKAKDSQTTTSTSWKKYTH